MDFIAALDAPVVRQIDSQEISFRVLTLADISRLAALMHARRLETAQAICREQKLDPVDRVTVLGQIQLSTPTPWDVARHADTLAGSREVLSLSLASAGISASQADAIIDRIPLPDITSLVRLVARITPPPLPGDMTDPTSGSPGSAAGSS